MMPFDVRKVIDDATRGGREITPTALAVAIRSAVMQCRDERGNINLCQLYELTCELERTPIDN